MKMEKHNIAEMICESYHVLGKSFPSLCKNPTITLHSKPENCKRSSVWTRY